MNRVTLIGRLTKDVELRYTQSGVAVGSFTMAVNRPFANQQGEREVDFIPVVVFKKQAENAANYLRKGSKAGVDGRIQVRSYEKDGRKVYVTEVMADQVEFLDSRNDAQGAPAPKPQQQQQNGGFKNDPFVGGVAVSDDDLPF